MSQHFKTYALLRKEEIISHKTVLIASGTQDDALYYLAQVQGCPIESTFTVLFHRSSRFLERVHLFGSMNVLCQLLGDGEYSATLEFAENLGENDSLVALKVSLLELNDVDISIGQPMLPIT